MKEIKFRGRREFSDEYIFGYYACHHYPTLGDFHFIVDEHGTQTSVDPESVKQLCGYDADGNEVYEDDTVYIDKDGYYREYVAHLKGYATNPKDGCYITLDGRFDARLKGEEA